jgi:hypothetical protein
MNARVWGTVLVALLAIRLGGGEEAAAEEGGMERRASLDRYLPVVTASLGVAGSAWFFASNILAEPGPDALFSADATVFEQVVIAVPATVAFGVTSYFAPRWFERTIVRRARTWWGAALWGTGLGAVTGAAIVTSGWLVTLAMGHPMGVIDTGAVGAAGYLAVLGMSVVSGGFWGGLAGLVPGAVAGPAIHLYAGR